MAPKHLHPHVLIVLLLLFSAFSFGAITRVALAEHFHTNCVGHGFVHGSSTTDGSFFSRVEHGCGTGTKYCAIYTWGSFVGDMSVAGSDTCNLWSRNYGTPTECASTAHVSYSGVFSNHVHKAHNWCG
jgi:hypothetical protein